MKFLAQVAVYWGVLPAALLLAGSRLDAVFAWDASILPPALRASGGALILAGLLACLKSTLWFLFRGEGLPSSAAPPRRLVTEGPFARCRHPVYLGYALAALGMGLAAGSPATAAVTVPAFAVVWFAGVRLVEERTLARRYGARWDAYAARVPFLVPILRSPEVGWHPGWCYLLAQQLVKRVLYPRLPVTVKGAETFPEEGGIVLVANHVSYLDPFFLIAAIPRPIRFLATAEIFRGFVSGRIFRALGAIPYRRYAPDPAALARFLRSGRSGEAIGLFPEGERSWDGRPRSMDRGLSTALAARLPVVPVRISGAYEFWPRTARRPRRAPVHLEFGGPLVDPSAADLLAALGGPALAEPGPESPPEGPMILSEGDLSIRPLRRVGEVRPELRERELVLGPRRVDLSSIRSVTVEGRTRLQLALEGTLIQLEGEQARPWQLLIRSRRR